jgi:putative ABC transport system permease protein
MTRFVDGLRQVLSAILAHKLRSFLTMFGIAWGVGSLLLLIGLGEGFRAGTEKGLASFGEDYMQIYNGRVPALGGSQLSSRQYYLNYQDYVDIRNSPYVRNAAPIIYRGDLRLVSEYGSSNGLWMAQSRSSMRSGTSRLNRGAGWIGPTNASGTRSASSTANSCASCFPAGR